MQILNCTLISKTYFWLYPKINKTLMHIKAAQSLLDSLVEHKINMFFFHKNYNIG